MRFLIALLLTSSQIYAQLTVVDSFSDGNHTENPLWFGDETQFIVNSDFELQLQAEATASPAELSLTTEIVDAASWSWYMKMDFNPSSQNYTQVIVYQHPTSSKSIFLNIGKTSDRIDLMYQNNSSTQLLASSPDGFISESSNELWFKVEHQNSTWSVEFSKNNLDWQSLPSVTQSVNLNSRFTFKTWFTTTRKDKFYFDDVTISGNAFEDTNPPVLDSFLLNADQSIELLFSEDLQLTSVQPANFSIQNVSDGIASMDVISPSHLKVKTKGLDFNQSYYLDIKNLKDLASLSIQDTSLVLFWQNVEVYDVLFNELMIDPEPKIYLPEYEYIELKNRQNYSINLDQFSLEINQSSMVLPNYTIPAQGLVSIYGTSAKTAVDSVAGVLFLESDFSLPNTEAQLSLKDSSGVIIHALHYSNEWYQNDEKSNGGWSLENTNAAVPCQQKTVWTASTHPSGGSPNEENQSQTIESRLADSRIWMSDRRTVHLEFPYLVLDSLYLDPDSYLFSKQVQFIERTTPFQLEFTLYDHLPENQLVEIEFIADLTCGSPKNFTCGFTEKPQSGELWISEILFDTDAEHTEFIEFQIGESPLNPYDLVWGTLKDGLWDFEFLSQDSTCFLPKQLIVLCKDLDALDVHYERNPEAVYWQPNSWLSLDDKSGECGLFLRNQDELERVCFDETWHSLALSSTENVSLERLSPNHDGCSSTSWISAKEENHFATPGFSIQSIEHQDSGSPDVFSPNGDQDTDLWQHRFQFSNPENTLNARVFSLDGREIKTLLNFQTVGYQYDLIWDGTNEAGELLTSGTYIVWVSRQSEQASETILKKAVSIQTN